MKKTGILTFHYANNYGAVLQSYALYNCLASKNIDAEIIDYVPSTYKEDRISRGTGLRSGSNLKNVLKRIWIKARFNKSIIRKFDQFRDANLKMSARVDEKSLVDVLDDYEAIIAGSDQIWGPWTRRNRVYFLGFDDFYRGNKISYAADSTVSPIEAQYKDRLQKDLNDFKAISVRNSHSQEFVEELTGKTVPIVVDPTVLCDFTKLRSSDRDSNERYIFVYVLGKDIRGTNKRAIERIKQVHGDMRVYAVVDPTRKFNVDIAGYVDKVFYDLGPVEWVDMLRNATFVFTDSFHGTLFSLKFHKPFLAYYAEDMRATRFMDLGNRYNIGKYIVTSVDEIDRSLEQPPDFSSIDCLIEEHKGISIEFLEAALNID